MRKKRFIIFNIIIALLLFATLALIVYFRDDLGIGDSEAAQQLALVQTTPTPGTDLVVGDIVTVELETDLPDPDPGDNPSVSEISISFDPQVLRGNSIVVLDDTLKLLDKIDNSNGKMSLDVAHIGPRGFEGKRALAIFTFKVVNDSQTSTQVTIDSSLTFGVPNIYDGAGQDLTMILNIVDEGGDDDGGGDDDQGQDLLKLPLHRFWSNEYRNHFFTLSESEKNSVIAKYPDDVWKYEGISYYALAYDGVSCPSPSLPVYRFWSDTFYGHFYTISENEKNTVIAKYPDKVWKYERVAYCAFLNQVEGTTAVNRFWSGTLQTHFYTISENEKQGIIDRYPESVWKYEGISFHAFLNQ